MRTAFTLFAFSCLILSSACTDDTTTSGVTTVDSDAVDALGDGALGTDDAIGDTVSDTIGAGDGTPDTPPQGSDVTASGLTCTQVGQCVEDACSSGAQPCGLTCAAGIGADVAGKIDALSSCMASKCQNGLCKGQMSKKCMDDCSGSQCGTPLLNCFEDNTPGGNPCNSALTCFDNCNKTATTGHFTCMAKCYDGLTQLGKTQLRSFTDCLAKGPGGDASLAACQSEYTTCATGGATGTGTCVDISKCNANCSPAATTCPGNCLAIGSTQAQTQINEMNVCFANNIPDQTKCFGQLQACAAPSGTGKCTGVDACTKACKKGFIDGDDKGSCTIGCLHDTSKVGADAFVALFACVIPNCPDCVKNEPTCQTCLLAKCQKEYNGCLAN
jgi:hypothetical protein